MCKYLITTLPSDLCRGNQHTQSGAVLEDASDEIQEENLVSESPDLSGPEKVMEEGRGGN